MAAFFVVSIIIILFFIVNIIFDSYETSEKKLIYAAKDVSEQYTIRILKLNGSLTSLNLSHAAAAETHKYMICFELIAFFYVIADLTVLKKCGNTGAFFDNFKIWIKQYKFEDSVVNQLKAELIGYREFIQASNKDGMVSQIDNLGLCEMNFFKRDLNVENNIIFLLSVIFFNRLFAMIKDVSGGFAFAANEFRDPYPWERSVNSYTPKEFFSEYVKPISKEISVYVDSLANLNKP